MFFLYLDQTRERPQIHNYCGTGSFPNYTKLTVILTLVYFSTEKKLSRNQTL